MNREETDRMVDDHNSSDARALGRRARTARGLSIRSAGCEIALSSIDLNLLVALNVLLQEEGVTRAASLLGIGQSALSHKLRRLRKIFSDKLLVSGRQGMVLTDRAKALRGPLKDALACLEQALQSDRSFEPTSCRRQFRIIASDYGQFVCIPGVLEEVSHQAPGLEVTVLPSVWDISEQLEAGTLDLVFLSQPIQSGQLRLRKVCSDEFVVVARRDHPALRNGLSLETYLGLKHILISAEGRSRNPIDHTLTSQGLKRRVALRVPQCLAALFVVARSDMLLTVPHRLVGAVRKLVDLEWFYPPIALPKIQACMMWHEQIHRDRAHAWFRELLVDRIQKRAVVARQAAPIE